MKLPIGHIHENLDNPRKITEEMFQKLVNSINEDPDIIEAKPLVVDKKNGEYVVLGGNMRLRALRHLGFTEAPVFDATDWPEETKRRFIVKDNLSNGIWDYELLSANYEMAELESWGMEEMDRYYIEEPDEKDDKIPEKPVDPISKIGDIYELGKHKVICGDSNDLKVVDKLFGNKQARLIFTSPPYNMNGGMYENYKDNLGREEYIDFNLNVLTNWQRYLRGFVFWNISYNKNARDEFIEILHRILKETGLKFLELIVWNKKTAMPIISKNGLTRQYEDVLVVGDEESIKEDIDMVGLFRNSDDAVFNTKTKKWLRNYWEISPLNSQLDNHKACFPVELPLRAMQIMTIKNDIIADPFLGSGSTLIACEKGERICYGAELDPSYCDVIVQRYVDFTGNVDIKKNGKSIKWQKE